MWPDSVVARASDSRLERSLVRLPAVPLSGNNLRQVVHTHVSLSPSSINWYRSNGDDAPTAGKVTVGLTSHWPRIEELKLGTHYPCSRAVNKGVITLITCVSK